MRDHMKNPFHEIRYHLMRDHMKNNDVMLDFVCTNRQLAYIFIKPLSEDRFC